MNEEDHNPTREAARLRDLKSFDILDTPPEADFDDIVEMAAGLCDTPLAAVTLIDERRQWIKASHGAVPKELPREESFCVQLVLSDDEVMLVPDATKDPRFAKLAAVKQPPGVRFYAGVPLRTPDDNVLGALCVLDTKVRDLDPVQLRELKILGRRVMTELELRRKNKELEKLRQERERSLKDLRDKNRWLRLAMKGYPGVMWDLDVATKQINYSPDLTLLLGLPVKKEPHTLEDLSAMVHPKDRAKLQDALEAHLADSSERFEVEYRMVDGDKSVRWYVSTGQAETDETGKAIRMAGFMRDETRRKNIEKSLAKSEHGMREAQRLAKMGSWYLDIASNQPTWSEELYHIFGLDPAEDAPKYSEGDKLFTPESWELLSVELAKTVDTRKPYKLELEFVRADGSRGWMLARGECVTDDDRNVVGLRGVVQDITKRRETDQRLFQQAELLDQAPDAFVVRDLKNRIEFWSAGAERIYGFSRDEVIGKDFAMVLHPEDTKFREAQRETVEHGFWQGEIEKRNKADEPLVLEARWKLLRDADGKPKSILTTDTDITERKIIEARFLRAQRMEGIGTLAGGIAHDLNNVLAPVLMGVSLLRQGINDPRNLTLLDNIDRSASRGAELVKQVLSFARGVEGARVSLQVRHITTEVGSIIRNTFPKNIELTMHVPSGLRMILGDPTQINQVLLNLCVNARDAMPNGGDLHITGANVEIDDTFTLMDPDAHLGHYVMIEVSDTGSGIPGNLLDRIYDPFFTTKEIGKGTGLGLSTVTGIVRSHGGFINVYSEPGKGTSFKVYLPADGNSTEKKEEEGAPSQENLHGNRETVLVVDDEISVLEITRQTLESFGYRTLTAHDGAEAIGIYAAHRDEISLVLTDMMMPVMDGPTLIQAIKHIEPEAKIIACSGLSDTAGVARASALGVTYFLSKPFSADLMLQMVKRLLEGQTQPPMHQGAG